MKLRLRFFYALLRPLVALFLKIKFGYKYEIAKNLPENYIVLSNHLTDYDPLFVGASFRRQMHFVASEHIARWGFAYTLLKFVFAPIIRYKGASGSAAVIEMMRLVRKGGNVCMFAEGVRSWDGANSPVLPSTAAVIQKAGCGLVTYKITGGYFASPMWAGASARRGPVTGRVVNVYTKQQLSEMTVSEIHQAILSDIHENAYERQLANPVRYRGKRLAEKLERLMFLCPECEKIDSFSSNDDTVSCAKCGLRLRYDEYGMLSGGTHKTLKQFSDWQKARVKAHVQKGVSYFLNHATLAVINGNHEETPVSAGKAEINPEFLSCGEASIPMSEISFMAMHGQRAVVFTAGKTYYELKPTDESNSLKFHLYYQALKG